MRRCFIIPLTILLAGLAGCNAKTEDIPFPAALEASSISQPGLSDIILNSLILGNGDINGLLYTRPEGLTLRITKNDVWDARLHSAEEPPLLKVDIPSGSWTGTIKSPGYSRPYPCPRSCGQLVFKGVNDGPAVLDIEKAVASVGGNKEVVIRALARDNVFLVESMTEVLLEPVADTLIPPAEQGVTGATAWIHQVIPGDIDWPGMHFSMAIGKKGNLYAVAVVSSAENADPVAAAIEKVSQTLSASVAGLVRDHEREWSSYWSASGVELENKFLQETFYRNLYFLRCVSKPGVQAVGLFAGLVNNTPAWHGDYHSNYNTWQTFWGAYSCNHAELTEPLDRLVLEYLPRGRWLADYTYNCRGIHFPISLFAYEPHPDSSESNNKRMHNLFPWSYTIGQTGWMVQDTWLHYKYEPDRKFLETVAYPPLSAAALFYADFMEKCRKDESGRIHLGPSYSPEHREFGIYNGTCDIAYIDFVFKAFTEAAGILGRDADLVKRITELLKLLPDYPLIQVNGTTVVTDVENGAPLSWNIPVPTLPVFPAGVVTWFSNDDTKKLFTETIRQTRTNGYNSSIMLPMAYIRMSLPEAHELLNKELKHRTRPNGTITLLPYDRNGHLTEQFASSGAIAELLLQSVGGILRIFPSWPVEMDARFTRLRAEGGFLVDGEMKDGKIVSLEIESTAGGLLKILNPVTNLVEEFDTRKNQRLKII